MTIKIGEQAPDFTLKNQDNEDISLSEFRGKNIALYFYPKDMTPGCTTQACDFRDNYNKFKNRNTVIIGISPDPVDSHQKFIEKHDLPFHLLADVDREVAELYDVWQLKKMFGREFYGIVRSTFIIDEEGILREEMRNIRVKGHVDRALKVIESL